MDDIIYTLPPYTVDCMRGFCMQGGVYQQKSNISEGGHAVKIIGWGTMDNLDYWIVANSWGLHMHAS